MKLSRKRLAQLGIGLALLVLLALAFRPSPVEVDVAPVVRGPLEVTIDEEGETRVRDRFVVSAPVAGRVLRIEHEPGDPVVAGETELAAFQPAAATPLDPRARAQAQARVEAAEAALGVARSDRDRVEAELGYARTERDRIRRLTEAAIVPQDQLDSTELALKSAEQALRAADFRIAAAKQELEAARAMLLQGEARPDGKPLVLRAPVDGVVLRRLRESEALVPAGEPLLEVGDPRRLEIVTDLLSQDAVKVTAGDPVLVEQWGGATSLRGRVRRVEPSGFTKISALGVEEQRVNVLIDFEDPLEAWQELGDGYRVEVRIVVWRRDDVAKAPTSSLFRHEGQWAVFAVEGETARLRPVEVGQRNGLEAEIAGGVGEGAAVVVHPSDQVKDGVAVVVRRR